MAAKLHTPPSVLYAEMTMLSGTTYSLALTRTRWVDEGQMVYEATAPDGTIEEVAPGAWFIRSKDNGPATLIIELADEDAADLEQVDLLTAKLVENGASWGIEARERLS